MKPYSCKSDGLGGFFGVSWTLRLGSRKRITNNKFHLFLIAFLFTLLQSTYSSPCLSLTLALQRSNDTYKYIKFPYSRVKHTSEKNLIFTRNCFFLPTVRRYCLLVKLYNYLEWRCRAQSWSRLCRRQH